MDVTTWPETYGSGLRIGIIVMRTLKFYVAGLGVLLLEMSALPVAATLIRVSVASLSGFVVPSKKLLFSLLHFYSVPRPVAGEFFLKNLNY